MEGRIETGLRRHLANFGERLQAGVPRLGWKVAFNAPAIQQKLGLPFSLVAGLTEQTRKPAFGKLSVGEFTRPAAEAEVAVWLNTDLRADSSPAQAAAAVSGWAPAIEVVDFDRPLSELEEILAHGVFHRAVVLGEPQPTAPGVDLSGITARVTLGDAEVCRVDALAATGQVSEVLLHLASLLAPLDEGLKAGDVVILGAMNPLTLVEANQRFTVELSGVGTVAVDLSR